MDPIHQFEIKTLFPIAKIGNIEIAFTNSALYMLIAVGIIALLMIGLTSRRAMVPGRFQALAEVTYEFIATTLQRTAGREGMKFFPLVFSLFMFILVLNIIALIPHTFAVMAQIIITASLALLVFFTVIIYGFWKHGFRFFKLLVPSGVPIYILPMVTSIEVLSFLSRPLHTAFACSPISLPVISRSMCLVPSSPCWAQWVFLDGWAESSRLL
jgi:F-type H+-transporting ATPase subunit a